MSEEQSVVPFEREERYIVVKIKDLPMDSNDNGEFFKECMRRWGIPIRDCVVVERDWPEYERVWAMIEGRMTQRPGSILEVSPALWEVRVPQLYDEIDPEEAAADYEFASSKHLLNELLKNKGSTVYETYYTEHDVEALRNHIERSDSAFDTLLELFKRVVEERDALLEAGTL